MMILLFLPPSNKPTPPSLFLLLPSKSQAPIKSPFTLSCHHHDHHRQSSIPISLAHHRGVIPRATADHTAQTSNKESHNLEAVLQFLVLDDNMATQPSPAMLPPP